MGCRQIDQTVTKRISIVLTKNRDLLEVFFQAIPKGVGVNGVRDMCEQIHSVHISEDKIIPKAVELVCVIFRNDVVPIVSSDWF